MSVRVYVEGGGPWKGRNTAAKCRQAFHLFFDQFGSHRSPNLVASGGRREAYDDFMNAYADPQRRDDKIFLLVDSEVAVARGMSAKQHLHENDNWRFGIEISENRVHMMVQCMETWFMADKNAVAKHFKHASSAQSLPQNTNIEAISKRDILDGLGRAARNAGKRGYEKASDGFAILSLINAQLVCGVSHHARHLRECLLEALA